MKRRPFSLLLLMILSSACHRRIEPPRQVTVGEHRLEIAVPQGWEVLDQGRRLAIRNGETEVVLSDLGPVEPDSFRDEIGRAAELWRNGRDDEARTRLRNLPLWKALFASREESDRFHKAFFAAAFAKRGTPWDDVAAEFESMRAQLDAMQPIGIDGVVEAVLPDLGEDARREVKSKTSLLVDGRPAIEVQTWMALTHAGPRRLLIVLNAGRALAVRCDRSDNEAAEHAFDTIARSIHFASGSRT